MTDQSNTKDTEVPATKQRLLDVIFCLVCGLVVGVAAWLADTNAPLEAIFPRVDQEAYNLLVQGFSAGQLNLKEEVPPGFTKLADPYDPNLNAPYMTGALNDMTFYKGKIYLYFGVTPALVFFWPYYALTGHFLSQKAAVAFFMGAGFTAIAGIVRALRRRYFPETGKWIPVAGVIMPGIALALTVTVNFHQVVITCGFAFVMLALAAIWAALHESGRRVFWLAVASFAYGLALGARPNLLWGAAILFLPVFQAWREATSSVSRLQPARISHSLAGVAAPLLAAAGPITCAGLCLMLYNFLRFNNPFEFGLHYQLSTTCRLPSAHLFSLNYFWYNFRLYFLHPVFWSGSFPFLRSAPLPPEPSGYDLGNDCGSGGALLVYPILFLILAAPLAWKRKEHGTALGWFAAACVYLSMAGAVTLTVYFASSIGYELEFLPGFLLLALIGTFGVDRLALRFPGRRRLFCLGWFLLTSYSLAFNYLGNVDARAETVFFVGNCYLSQGRFDQAQAEYQKTLASYPECADAYGGLGSICFKEGRLDEAIVEYQKALEISPDLVEVHNNLGRCLLRKGQVDAAIAQFETAVQMRPRSVNYRNALGAAYAKKGLWPQAIVQFENSIEIEPALPDAHDDLGYCLLQIGRVDDAIAEQRIAVKLEPASPTYSVSLANALCQKGSFDEATLEYKRALQLDPNDTEALNNLAYCLQQTGHTDEAIARYEEAIKIQPNMAGAYYNLGNLYREKKMASQAANSYEKAIELAPQFAPAQLDLAWMLATWPDAAVRNGAKSVALAKHLNDLGPGNDPKTLRTLAAAYAETGNFAEASATAKQALALALAQSDSSLTNALQTEINFYLKHVPVRSTSM